MKILIYLDSMAPAGGIERVVSKHTMFFSKNHDVTLMVKDKKESFYALPDMVKVYSLDVDNSMNMQNKTQRIIQTVRQLAQSSIKLKKFSTKYDLFYVTHVRNLLELYLSGVDMKKVLITEHGSYYAYNKIYKGLKHFLYPKCKYIVSPTMTDYNIYLMKSANSVYIPNPLSFFSDHCSSLRNKKVLNIGRFTDDKRQILLLKIWEKVSKLHPEWNLEIIGSGELEKELRSTINELSLSDSVIISKPIHDIEPVFLKSSLLLLTSKFEGFGMVLAEAMACGVPTISFNVPSGPKDIINHKVDGFLINDGDINEYISRVDELMSNMDKRISMGRAGKRNIRKFLDVKVERMWLNLLGHTK